MAYKKLVEPESLLSSMRPARMHTAAGNLKHQFLERAVAPMYAFDARLASQARKRMD